MQNKTTVNEPKKYQLDCDTIEIYIFTILVHENGSQMLHPLCYDSVPSSRAPLGGGALQLLWNF